MICGFSILNSRGLNLRSPWSTTYAKATSKVNKSCEWHVGDAMGHAGGDMIKKRGVTEKEEETDKLKMYFFKIVVLGVRLYYVC